MHWKHFTVLFLSLLVVSAAAPLRAQVTHAATEGKLPLTVGTGWSNYSVDWGPSSRMDGITVWADWRLRGMPGFLKGLSISAEGQCICWNVPDIGKHKLEAGLGGPSYRYERWERVRPYVKYLIGFGGMTFTITSMPSYTHDTRVIYAPGGGADIRVWNKLAVRGDYEYQFWPNLFPNTSNPNGFTIGAVWDFGIRPPQQ